MSTQTMDSMLRAAPPGATSSSAWPRPKLAARLEASFLTFVTLWMFVGLVSAYDGYLTVRYQHMLHLLEENPVGRWMMDLDDGLVFNRDYGYVASNHKVAAFLGCKFAGTILALGLMLVVHRYQARLGLLVSGIIAGLQGALAVYLSCY